MTYGVMASPNESGMLLEHRDARETLGKRRGGVVGASFKEVATCAYEVDPKAYFPKAVNCFSIRSDMKRLSTRQHQTLNNELQHRTQHSTRTQPGAGRLQNQQHLELCVWS